MSTYRRPVIATPVFRDQAGRVINYGHRWGDTPPEDSYSVVSHPERFAPVGVVAEALIAHLQETYEVSVTDGLEVATDLMWSPDDVSRAARIVPHDPACAPLTFVFVDGSTVFMHAGLLHDFLYPVCSCDACDSVWPAEADDLEQQVFAVVSGHYTERLVGRGWVEHAFTYPGGGASSGRSRTQDIERARMASARPVLQGVRGGWAPWPVRLDGGRHQV